MLDVVKKIIHETPVDKYSMGIAAKFMPIDDIWGLQFYNNKEDRDKTYSRQNEAWRHGLAPRLGKKFRMTTPTGKVYGYITEVVETLYDRAVRNAGYDIPIHKFCNHENSSIRQACYKEEEKLMDKTHDQLLKDLEDIGLYTGDMHWGNVGWLPDGRLVAIDFSE